VTERIGPLRRRVRLESPHRADDDMGGAALSWIDEGDVWAVVRAIGASQSAVFDAAPSVSSFNMIINRRDDVRSGWRVLWGARAMRIIGKRDDGGPRIELFCEEESL
jgi:head-tail adaptor